MAVTLALVLAATIGALNIVPVRSQSAHLEVLQTPSEVPIDAPWHAVWDSARSEEVPLSAQNIAPPFGGGFVQGVIVRALHDDERLYLLLEWSDPQPNDAVNGFAEFSDAAAVQFPSARASGLPPFFMGGPGAPVNIWQWKAVWQADIVGGFTTSQTRYPNTVVDTYPNSDDPIYRPAQHVGNPLAQREHVSPVENLIAEGFGTLTHAEVQDVAGSGEWRNGRWRALFARGFDPADESHAAFSLGTTTNIAFAVWDGGSGDRDGVKSIAPFIELDIGSGAALGGADAEGFGAPQVLIMIVIALSLAAAIAIVIAVEKQSQRPPA